jgi:hypothetical protein
LHEEGEDPERLLLEMQFDAPAPELTGDEIQLEDPEPHRLRMAFALGHGDSLPARRN